MYSDDIWIAEQFAGVELGDARRTRRAQRLALSMIQAPSEGLPTQTHTWGDCKAAYRLLHCEDVTHDAVLQPHFEHTRDAAAAQPVTLFIQDSTHLDFTRMKQAQGYGPIGNNAGTGLIAHSLLAATPDGEVLGLAAQSCWARSTSTPHRRSETRVQRYVRANKESEAWPKALEAVGAVPEGCRWVSIGDRESDSFEYWSRATALGWQCLSRIYSNRRTTDHNYLLKLARALPIRGKLQLPQRARPGQAARTLHLNLAWRTVQVRPTRKNPNLSKLPDLAASVVRCWDPQHNVEWLLLATWPVVTLADAIECVHWYQLRWTIEIGQSYCLRKSQCHARGRDRSARSLASSASSA